MYNTYGQYHKNSEKHRETLGNIVGCDTQWTELRSNTKELYWKHTFFVQPSCSCSLSGTFFGPIFCWQNWPSLFSALLTRMLQPMITQIFSSSSWLLNIITSLQILGICSHDLVRILSGSVQNITAHDYPDIPFLLMVCVYKTILPQSPTPTIIYLLTHPLTK